MQHANAHGLQMQILGNRTYTYLYKVAKTNRKYMERSKEIDDCLLPMNIL